MRLATLIALFAVPAFAADVRGRVAAINGDRVIVATLDAKTVVLFVNDDTNVVNDAGESAKLHLGVRVRATLADDSCTNECAATKIVLEGSAAKVRSEAEGAAAEVDTGAPGKCDRKLDDAAKKRAAVRCRADGAEGCDALSGQKLCEYGGGTWVPTGK